MPWKFLYKIAAKMQYAPLKRIEFLCFKVLHTPIFSTYTSNAI